jgi:hypothetical protein
MPQYNGQKASWNNFAIKVKSETFSFDPEDFSAASWKQTLTPGLVPGRGAGAIGTTGGEYTTEASITIARAGARSLMQFLREAHPLGKAGYTEFDVRLEWEPESGDPGDFLSADWKTCRLTEAACDMAKGTDAAMVTLPINVMRIFDDGVCLIGND